MNRLIIGLIVVNVICIVVLVLISELVYNGLDRGLFAGFGVSFILAAIGGLFVCKSGTAPVDASVDMVSIIPEPKIAWKQKSKSSIIIGNPDIIINKTYTVDEFLDNYNTKVQTLTYYTLVNTFLLPVDIDKIIKINAKILPYIKYIEYNTYIRDLLVLFYSLEGDIVILYDEKSKPHDSLLLLGLMKAYEIDTKNIKIQIYTDDFEPQPGITYLSLYEIYKTTDKKVPGLIFSPYIEEGVDDSLIYKPDLVKKMKTIDGENYYYFQHIPNDIFNKFNVYRNSGITEMRNILISPISP